MTTKTTIGHAPKNVKRKKPFKFGLLLREAIQAHSPVPIAHKHTPSSRRFLSPLQMTMLLSTVTTARGVWGYQNHLKAFAYGGKGITNRINESAEHKITVIITDRKRKAGASKSEAPFPQRAEHPTDKFIPLDGKRWYNFKKHKLKKGTPPDVIEVVISPYKLFKQVHLNLKNFENIDGDLDRLCKPIGKLPPLLLSWERRADRKIILRVSGVWLDKPYFVVPLPLPIRSPTATALWIWLWAMVGGKAEYAARGNRDCKVNDGDVGIYFEELCRRIGIPPKYGRLYESDKLMKAFEIVNAHLAEHPSKKVGEFKFYVQEEGKRIWIVPQPPTVEQAKGKPKANPKAEVKAKQPRPGGKTPRTARILDPQPIAAEPPKQERKVLDTEQANMLDDLRQWISSIPPEEQKDAIIARWGVLTSEQRAELTLLIESKQHLNRHLNRLKSDKFGFSLGMRLSDLL